MKSRITYKIIYKHKDGSILDGIRVVEGTKKIRQVIVYKGKYIPDNETYTKGQEERMEVSAQQIMFEFAMGRTLQAKDYKSNIKF